MSLETLTIIWFVIGTGAAADSLLRSFSAEALEKVDRHPVLGTARRAMAPHWWALLVVACVVLSVAVNLFLWPLYVWGLWTKRKGVL